MKFYVYVIKSLKNNRRYIGQTSKDIVTRLKEHNAGTNKYTRNNRPYKLIYYEVLECRKCAARREKFLKSGQGRIILNKVTT